MIDIKNEMADAATVYYQNLSQQYILIFALFIALASLMFTAFMIFGYRGIRDTMWRTNLTLKIMPLDYIPRSLLPELKSFYKY